MTRRLTARRSRSRAPQRARALVVALLALPLLAVAGPAQAHTGVERAVPANGEVLTAPPGQVALSFEGPVSRPVVLVTAPDGTGLSAGSAAVEGRTALQTLSASTAGGRYTVTFQVLGADGHKIQGKTYFEVAPSSARTTAAVPAVSTPSSPAPVVDGSLSSAAQLPVDGALLPVAAVSMASASSGGGSSQVQPLLGGGAAALVVAAWAGWLRHRRAAASSGRG